MKRNQSHTQTGEEKYKRHIREAILTHWQDKKQTRRYRET